LSHAKRNSVNAQAISITVTVMTWMPKTLAENRKTGPMLFGKKTKWKSNSRLWRSRSSPPSWPDGH
jgi:hypothetical protein